MKQTYLKNYRITVTTDGELIHSEESVYPSYFSMSRILGERGIALADLQEGQSASKVFTVAVDCLLNRLKPKAPRRAPDVIAAEKAAKLVKQQARAEQRRKAEERAARIRKAKRVRITQQIDHAFMTGHESGSEPVSKYVTCDYCSGPADFLYVNVPLAPGAAVLDEGTITDAVCAEHNHAAGNSYFSVAEIIPCSRLEFFYTGIRQIAIKAKTL